MKITPYIQTLMRLALSEEPNYGDGESVLTMLYECYSDSTPDG